MKTRVIICSLIVVLSACCRQETKVNSNAILGDKVNVRYVEKLIGSSNPDEWMENMEREKLFTDLFHQVLDNNKEVYNPNQNYFVPDTMTKESIFFNMNWEKDERNFNDLKQILFYEEWDVSNDLKKFTKKVNFWCPIIVWERERDIVETLRRKVFHVKPTENTKGYPIAKSIFTEFDMSPAIWPSWTGMDHEKFITIVFNKLEDNSIKAYDPIYIVDKSKREFSVSDIEEYVGETLNSGVLISSVSSFIFEENWYFDSEIMNIYKEVLSMGFVKKYWKDGKDHSKILFFIEF